VGLVALDTPQQNQVAVLEVLVALMEHTQVVLVETLMAAYMEVVQVLKVEVLMHILELMVQ
jgi:hypothetical protein